MATLNVSLNVDDDLLARARTLAAARKMTVEEMLERLLRVVAQPPLLVSELPPNTRKSLGLLLPMSDKEVERVIHEERLSKYESGDGHST